MDQGGIFMTVRDIIPILQAEVVCGEELLDTLYEIFYNKIYGDSFLSLS